jgi:hypothetical protein
MSIQDGPVVEQARRAVAVDGRDDTIIPSTATLIEVKQNGLREQLVLKRCSVNRG